MLSARLPSRGIDDRLGGVLNVSQLISAGARRVYKRPRIVLGEDASSCERLIKLTDFRRIELSLLVDHRLHRSIIGVANRHAPIFDGSIDHFYLNAEPPWI
jgi:hypothetical protein